MFTYLDELYLSGAQIWIDARKPRPCAFISHAHSDHTGRHGQILATAETLLLCRRRLGSRPGHVLGYGQPLAWREVHLTAWPAGHVLGSAMLHVRQGTQSLLYTGDFRLRTARTCPPAQPVHADVLIMECTYGHPRYRFPDRREVEEQVVRDIRQALRLRYTPVILAYSLGKAQEIQHFLEEAGLPVMVHPSIARINEVYRSQGISLGSWHNWDPTRCRGCVCLVPPACRRRKYLLELPRPLLLQLTGWALDRYAHVRLGVDRVYPYSDHADFDELLQMVRRVAPKTVYCTHGPAEFVRHLIADGWDARRLGAASYQQALF